MRKPVLAAILLSWVLSSCAAAAGDDDGEIFFPGPMTAQPAKSPEAVPVVVDTDLAPDDLAAIALLVRHPDVDVVGITVPTTGELTCVGLQLLPDLFRGMRASPPPVACGGSARGPEGLPFPQAWSMGAMQHSGLVVDADPTPLTPSRLSSSELIARLARRHEGLHVVALGPLTDVARLLRRNPGAYRRLAGITSMAGSVDAPSHAPGVAEWNAAADPVPFAQVLAGPVPVTVVPDDPVERGAPAGLRGPVVGSLGRDPAFETPAYWDLATAGVFISPDAATVIPGTWEVDVTEDRGRLRRTGDGPVHVVTALDPAALDRVYATAFG